MTASRQTEESDKVKVALLLHAIGPEGLEVCNTFEFTDDDKKDGVIEYGAVMSKFEAHYVPKVNITFERHRFSSRYRQPGESVDKFVRDLPYAFLLGRANLGPCATV
jgi:hypothetical protein